VQKPNSEQPRSQPQRPGKAVLLDLYFLHAPSICPIPADSCLPECEALGNLAIIAEKK
jgi:hypothetical protein